MNDSNEDKKKWKGDGLDISKFALKIAKTNAKIQQVSNRIKFIKTDIDNFNGSKYDLIVSNPPYINKIEYNKTGLYYSSNIYGKLFSFHVLTKR